MKNETKTKKKKGEELFKKNNDLWDCTSRSSKRRLIDKSKAHNRNGKRSFQKHPLVKWLYCPWPLHHILVIFLHFLNHAEVLRLDPLQLRLSAYPTKKESAAGLIPSEADGGQAPPSPAECPPKGGGGEVFVAEGITLWRHLLGTCIVQWSLTTYIYIYI